jgi:hypothetical protein
VWRGVARQVGYGAIWNGATRSGKARQGEARSGKDWLDTARQAWQGRQGKARRVPVRPGIARQVRTGPEWWGVEWRGKAGEERLGKVG